MFGAKRDYYPFEVFVCVSVILSAGFNLDVLADVVDPLLIYHADRRKLVFASQAFYPAIK